MVISYPEFVLCFFFRFYFGQLVCTLFNILVSGVNENKSFCEVLSMYQTGLDSKSKGDLITQK